MPGRRGFDYTGGVSREGKDRDRRQQESEVADDRRQRERRGAERVPLEIWVEEVHGPETLYRQTGNLSLGGVQLERGFPKPIGTRVRLRDRKSVV